MDPERPLGNEPILEPETVEPDPRLAEVDPEVDSEEETEGNYRPEDVEDPREREFLEAPFGAQGGQASLAYNPTPHSN
ncbi:hypothetical protein BSR29_02235 [Boudabousia liubingyangii]|uniref:Uncharacterized protein n=1 Tax=Boudabousia liubingyangii TaxID=1921764 RepID=A0A1Q5PQ92_9ACTO|nr:hypothetical protein [Boudabousia liubingyangii]OKL48183.1 hypothetical protein BSR28_00250 [Boudabousia liubingyangii]OKL49788.1 hypothetical protein BSR29_02235 [Boudabousia liubingyangii]